MLMRHRGLKFLAIAMAVLGTVLVGAGASSAKPTGAGAAPEPTASAPDAPAAPVTVGTGSGRASVRLACGNTFDPPAPQGGAMTHFYKNCNGFSITVTTGFQDLTGQITAFGGNRVITVPNLGEVFWSYSATRPNVNYHTIIVG